MFDAFHTDKFAADRRGFLRTTLIGGAAAISPALYPALAAARSNAQGENPAPCSAQVAQPAPAPEVKSFELDEITISDLQDGMKSGKFSTRSLVEKYSLRIDVIDKHGPRINSVLELNPDALSIADALDRERKSKGPRGPMHGIPVLIKDNIDTADGMMTTAGSRARASACACRHRCDSEIPHPLRRLSESPRARRPESRPSQ